jgi:hypothetical protein
MSTQPGVLVEELYAELERGRIYEATLRDPQFHLDGLSDGENIYIDPRPAILETLVHELLHRRYRRWGERRVTVEARRVIGKMDEQTMRRWWASYRRLAKKGRPVDVEAR